MKQVPFFANTPDDTHCVQASFRIMLKYFLPERDFSYDELDKMSRKELGKGTWWPPMLIELQKLGLRVRNIEAFDYQKYYEQGDPYLKAIYRPETVEYYLKRSNVREIRPLIPNFLKKVAAETRPATFEDLDELLADGWLVGIDLNSAVLNELERDDFVGHMVVVFDKQNGDYLLHDPGLKPKPNRRVSQQKLAKAWLWSGPETTSLVAVKLNEDS